MYQELITDSRKLGYLKVWDKTPSTEYSLTFEKDTGVCASSGDEKSFKGVRNTKWKKNTTQVWPPPLNNVTIGVSHESAESWFYETPAHPIWGRRKWEGHIAAELADRLMLRSKMPGISTIDTGHRDMALQRALGNVEQPDFNSQLFLAEIAETVSMLMNPFAGIQKIYKRYSKGRRRIRDLLRSNVQVQADIYLQYMFGIKPLISDVQDIYGLVRQKSIAENRLYGKGTSKSLERLEIGGIDTSYATSLQNLVWNFRGETKIKTVSKMYYNLRFASTMYNLVNKWGFNPIMLPVTMWEKVPLSFVVDWWFGIKQWLMAMRPKPGVALLGNSTSEKLTQHYTATAVMADLTIKNVPAVKWSIPIDKKYVYEQERLIRQVNLPVPTGILSKGGIDSVGKAVSAAALAFQKLKL